MVFLLEGSDFQAFWEGLETTGSLAFYGRVILGVHFFFFKAFAAVSEQI